jgi:hypothetical protein
MKWKRGKLYYRIVIREERERKRAGKVRNLIDLL